MGGCTVKKTFTLFFWIILGSLLLGSCSDQGNTVNGSNNGGNLQPTYTQVLAIFQANCTTSCHSGTAPTGNLDLTTYAGLMDSIGPHAPVITPFLPDSSYLVKRIRGIVTPPMPLIGSALQPSQIDSISDWIAAGALNN